jgi:hypothetical protein
MFDKIKGFFHAVTMDLLRVIVGLAIVAVTVLAVLFVLSIPDIIGMLIFG